MQKKVSSNKERSQVSTFQLALHLISPLIIILNDLMMITFYSLIYLLVLTNVFNHSVSIVSNDHNLNNIALISDQKAFINLGSDILIRCDLGIDESIFVIEKHHLDDLKHLIAHYLPWKK